MSKFKNPSFIIIILTSILILQGIVEVFADNIAPEVRTQINKRTDLFQRSINDLSAVGKSLEDEKQATINAMGDGKGLSSITTQSKGELEASSRQLESIHENDLNSYGREEMMKNNIINKLYPDYSRPLNRQYMKDAKALADGQNKLMANLLARLKDIGVDCKTIKGDKKHEPEYFLKIKTTEHKDTIYNQKFCEELRNKYHCNDEAALKCTRIRTTYINPQARTIRFNGHTLHNQKMNWGFAQHWKTKRWGWHITPYHPRPSIQSLIGFGSEDVQADSCWRDNPAAIIADARAYIAATLRVSIEHIGEDVTFPASGRGIGNITPVNHRWREVWDEYEFGYTYREIHRTCEEWQEEWNERCRLQ